MIPCEVCGNDIPEDERVCRFCGSHQTGVGSAGRGRGGGGGRGGGRGGSRSGAGRGRGGSARGARGGADFHGSGRVRTLNLEQGRPTVEQALSRFDMKLDTWRRQGVKLVRVIHGYGSSGTGGAIRSGVRRHLSALRGRGLVRASVPGEDYPDGSSAAGALLQRHADLRGSLRTDRANPGITFVEL